MDTERSVDQQIQAEIERLRGEFLETQDLYREACVLLFFRFGITPTANKLYQFVRKGSMSAPAQALTKFWDDLREKSRIRIEHPDLPEDLRTAAGELAAALWNKAQASAQETLAEQRLAAQAEVAAANAAQVAAEGAMYLARRELEVAQNEARQASEEIRSLEQRLAAEVAGREAAEAQLNKAGDEIHRLQSAIEQARHEFAAELEKQRASVRLTEERFQAAEERALVEIDRERTQSTKLQRELEKTRAEAAQQAEHQRFELTSLQTSVGEVRQQLGVLEGSLQAAIASREELATEAASVRAQLTDALSQSSALRVEVDNWRRRAEEAQTTVAEMQAKAARRPRKG